MLSDRGVLTTLDAATGRMLRQDRVRGVSDNYYASPVAGDGKIFLASHKGVVAVLRAGGQQELLAANSLDEEIFATPAIASWAPLRADGFSPVLFRHALTAWCVAKEHRRRLVAQPVRESSQLRFVILWSAASATQPTSARVFSGIWRSRAPVASNTAFAMAAAATVMVHSPAPSCCLSG